MESENELEEEYEIEFSVFRCGAVNFENEFKRRIKDIKSYFGTYVDHIMIYVGGNEVLCTIQYKKLIIKNI